jgi:hypothetical protein
MHNLMFHVYSIHGYKLGEVDTLEAGQAWEQAYYIYQDGKLVWRKEPLELPNE